MWHANGTTGEERLGAGGEVEALRPPARSPLFAGASNRHHLPTVGRRRHSSSRVASRNPSWPGGAISDSMPEVKQDRSVPDGVSTDVDQVAVPRVADALPGCRLVPWAPTRLPLQPCDACLSALLPTNLICAALVHDLPVTTGPGYRHPCGSRGELHGSSRRQLARWVISTRTRWAVARSSGSKSA
jgi:hypothetical protein